MKMLADVSVELTVEFEATGDENLMDKAYQAIAERVGVHPSELDADVVAIHADPDSK